MKLEDVILRGLRAGQPLATDVPTGAIYCVTDESLVERSNGSEWELFAESGGGGGGGSSNLPLAEPLAPTVVVEGTPGSTVYHYQIVANNAIGSTNAGKFSTTLDSPDVLDEINFNNLTWPAVSDATSYDIYRQLGTETTWSKIASLLETVTFDDIGIVGTVAAAPTVNTTAIIPAYAQEHAVRYLTDSEIKALPTTPAIILLAFGENTLVEFNYGSIIGKFITGYDNVGTAVFDFSRYLLLSTPSLTPVSDVILPTVYLLNYPTGPSSYTPLRPLSIDLSGADGTSSTQLSALINNDYVLSAENSGNSDYTSGDPANMLIVHLAFTRIQI